VSANTEFNDHPRSDEFPDLPPVAEKKPMFVSNSGGVGLHPADWRGWVILLVAVAIILCVVILIRRG